MLETAKLHQSKEHIIQALSKRANYKNLDKLIEEVILLDEERKRTQTGLDAILSDLNKKSKEIGALFGEGKKDEANALRIDVSAKKEESKALETRLKDVIEELEEKLLQIPNVPHELVKPGKGEHDNEIFEDHKGELPTFDFEASAHWDLAKKYNLIDFELGAKITGSGFPLYRGKGAKLQRALITYFLNEAEKAGFEEIIPPLLVNAESAKSTGQLPDKEGQMYHAVEDDLYLIPTAEVPITNIYRDVILEEKELPVRMCGYTPCFRREAGSYGADVKGLNRVHQFDKVEIVVIDKPENSYFTLESMLNHVAGLLKSLNLPFRILRLCGGDLGFTSALTYDFEVYSAAQKKWLEVSSVSNFETYQSNRLKLRYRDESRKTQLAHTLNGSALALARIVAAILENNQTEDRIVIPEVLRPFTGFDYIG